MNILHIDSSILGSHSVSRILTAKAVGMLKQQHPGATVVVRDLAEDAPQHLSNELLPALGGPKNGLTASQQAELERIETWLAEFLAADVLVVGAPQYNFNVPTQLKAWFDRIAQSGRTFRYSEHGPVGLVDNKRVIVVSTRGGFRKDPNRLDLHEQTVDALFHLLGISDITYIRAECMGHGDEQRAASIAAAEAALRVAIDDDIAIEA
jgi:FMN-dependent NADH-azoreductase